MRKGQSVARERTFNSFPVASHERPRHRILHDQSTAAPFNSFPVASRRRREQVRARDRRPFNSFPVASRAAKLRVAMKGVAAFNSSPVASRYTPSKAPLSPLPTFQFFPSCLYAILKPINNEPIIDFQFFPSCLRAGVDFVDRWLRGLSILSQLPQQVRQRKGVGARAIARFQFFPSCLLTFITHTDTYEYSSSFNSFPVASLQGLQGEGKGARGIQAFNSFPVASREPLQNQTVDVELDLSILSQLPLHAGHDAARRGTALSILSQLPPGWRRWCPGAAEPRLSILSQLPLIQTAIALLVMIAILSILSQLPQYVPQTRSRCLEETLFQFFPSCLRCDGCTHCGKAHTGFQFFPSCLGKRNDVVAPNTAPSSLFQFFPSCLKRGSPWRYW